MLISIIEEVSRISPEMGATKIHGLLNIYKPKFYDFAVLYMRSYHEHFKGVQNYKINQLFTVNRVMSDKKLVS